MRGRDLKTLRSMLKAEVGNTLDAGVNTSDDARFNQLLFNKQLELASQYTWPFLRDREDVQLVGGQRFYPLPFGLSYERPFQMATNLWNNIWTPTDYGIDEYDYNVLNSLPNAQGIQACDPIRKWLIVNQTDFPFIIFPTATLGFAGVLTGAYSYGYTYVTVTGETVLSPVTATINPSSQKVNVNNIADPTQVTIQGVNIPMSSVVTGKNIYRTIAGGSTYFLLTTLALGTTSYLDNTADSGLGSQTPPTTSSTPVSFFEVWPIPITSQSIRFTGERLLDQLINDDDTADLDDLLLVYACAAEECADRGLAKTQMVQGKFQNRLRQLFASMPTKRPVFIPGCGLRNNVVFKRQKRVLLG